MKLAVYKKSGEKEKDLEVGELFSVKTNAKSVTQYINYLRNALRGPVANTKDRSEVSGGGKKPWRQKGTGNARVGSSRSPLWVGGGVTFGPTSARNFSQRINAKQKKGVILGILAEIASEKKLHIVDNFELTEIKTKEALKVIENIDASGKISVILTASDKNAHPSLRNVAGVFTMTPNTLNIPALMSSNKVIASVEAIKQIETNYQVK